MSTTPPVSREGFSFANDSFFAEASNQKQHRRATLPELQALFHPHGRVSSNQDPVGHWYEAQLLHYGLAPSRSKAVAKTRLLDAVNRGVLIVPQRLTKLEDEVRREWLKMERATRRAMKSESVDTKPANNTKRRREDDYVADSRSVTVNVSLIVAPDCRITTASTPKRSKPNSHASKASPASSDLTAASRGGGSVRGRGTLTSSNETPRP